MKTLCLRPLAFLTFAFSLQPSAFADLSAIVSPGYTFGSGERADTSKLNRLGNPSITIVGTVGGTNANIAANSVNGTMLVNGLPGSNLTWDASSPRKLVIANDGASTNQISSDIAGLGLSGGSGSPLRVNVDTNTITIANDMITLNLTTFSNLVNTLATNTAYYLVTNYANTNVFITPELPLTIGTLTNMAHGLAVKPTNLRAVLICKTAEGQYAVNDEIDARNVWNNQPTFAFGANTTNVFVTCGAGTGAIPDKNSGNTLSLTFARWRFKIYATP